MFIGISIGTYAAADNGADVQPPQPPQPIPPDTGEITGLQVVGETATVSDPGDFTNSPTSYLYQWTDSLEAPLVGETAEDYVLQVSDEGPGVGCFVQGVNVAGAGAARWIGPFGPITAAFTPLSLDDELIFWWDSLTGVTIDGGFVTDWTERKAGFQLNAQGQTTLTFDGAMLVFPGNSFMFSSGLWSLANNFEIWQIVDQQVAVGTGNSYSFCCGSGQKLESAYTPPIGGQFTGLIQGGTEVFGGDNYHGVHVVRWVVEPNFIYGWIDGDLGMPVQTPMNIATPSGIFVGSNLQGAGHWIGRIGDTVVTKKFDQQTEADKIHEMWNYLLVKAGLPPLP